jgi:hypothetical protein
METSLLDTFWSTYMQFLRNPLAIALAALSLGMGGAALAQTTVTAQATVVGTTGSTTGSTTGTTTGTTAPTTQVPRNFSTDLAKASLAKQGITNPTKAQLDAERKAINAQRAQGKGWGVIAQSLGLNLGQVVSEANRARRDARKAERDEKGDKDKHDTHGKKGREDGKESGDHKGPSHKSGTTKSGTSKSSATPSGTTKSGGDHGGSGNGGGHSGGNGGGGGGGGHGGK